MLARLLDAKPSSILVLGACLAAFALRVAFSTPIVFPEDGFVNLQGTDAWYHYRAVDSTARSFPDRPVFDQYLRAPSGDFPRTSGLFDLTLAAAVRVVGMGEASSRTAAAVCAWAPPVLAGLLPIPVYLLGRALFGSMAGLSACWLIAILPGNLLVASRLGFADHHIAETLLASWTLYALVRSLQRERSLGWAALAGVCLGAYLGVWVAGVFLVALICAWGALDCVASWRWGAPARGLIATVGVIFGLAEAMLLSYAPTEFSWMGHTALVGGFLGLAAIAFTTDALHARGTPVWVAIALLAGLGGAGLGALKLLAPEWFTAVIWEFARFGPDPARQTILELQPLFFPEGPSGRFSPAAPWQQFTAAFPVGVAALVLLAGRIERKRERLLFVVWSLLMLLATLAKVRTSYYLAVNLAVLSGWALAVLVEWRGRMKTPWRNAALALAAAVLYLPNLPLAISTVRIDSGPPIEWREVLSWLRTETPEPYSDPAEYFRIREGPLPRPAYGVMNWWSSGHWIIPLARRVPVSSGFQGGGADDAAYFYLAQYEWGGLALAQRRRARYVLTDQEQVMPGAGIQTVYQAKIQNMVTRVRQDFDDYLRLFYRNEGGRLVPFIGYSPRYFRTMLVRLETFKGEAVEDSSVWVVRWRDGDYQGRWYRHAIAVTEFESHREAERYVAAPSGDNLSIVSLDPTKSCVYLRALERFRLARDGKVKVFEIIER